MKQSALGIGAAAMFNASASVFGQQQQADKIAVPTANEVLAIAKKYYDARSAALNGELKAEFSGKAGAVTFDGKSNDQERAEALCTDSAVIAVLQGDGNFAVASAAAAVGWAKDYDRSANALAAVLTQAGFITDKDKFSDAVKLALYAVSLDAKNPDFYITLANALYGMGDIAGAIAALDKALALEPGNNTALTMKLNMLPQGGGVAEAPKTGGDIKQNDGELSQRDTEQEKKTEGMEEATDKDSKESALKKLEELYELEVITPSDMLDAVFPEQAEQLRVKIVTVTPEQKELSFPEFPSGLFQNARQMRDDYEAIKKYSEWLHHDYNDKVHVELKKLDTIARKAEAKLRAEKRTSSSVITQKTSVDYMLEYNLQVVHAASTAYLQYSRKVWDEHTKEMLFYTSTSMDRYNSVHEVYLAEMEAAHSQAEVFAATKKFEHARNEIADWYAKAVISRVAQTYSEITQESQRYWEFVIPFARCTDLPEISLSSICSQIMTEPMTILDQLTSLPGAPHEDVSYADVQEAQEKAQKALEAAMNAKANAPNASLDFTVSVAYGPVEFKIGPNKVELEYTNGVAGRVQYDWKNDQMTLGVGAGGKLAKIGVSPSGPGYEGLGTGMELSAKTYVNFVFQTRKGKMSTAELCEVYVTGDMTARANAGTANMRVGASGKVSLYGSGSSSMAVAVKQEVAKVAVQHKKELVKKDGK